MRFLSALFLLLCVWSVRAQTSVYNFAWDASTDPTVFDYRLYWGFYFTDPVTHGSAAKLSNQVDVGSLLTGSITIPWSQDTDTYLVGAAVMVVGWDGTQETGPSNIITVYPSPSPTPTASPTPTPSATPTASPTPSPTPTVSPTPSPTPSPMPTPSATPTPTPTTTATPTPSATPTPTPTPSPTPTASPTPTPSATATPPQCAVPNFIGLKLNRAQTVWNSAGFTTTVTTIGPLGHAIVSQSLPVNSLGSCATAAITVKAQ